MKKLYIHLGTHKTGTTSIQKLCYKFSQELKEEDIHIVKHKEITHKNNFNNHEVSKNELVSSLNVLFKEKLKLPQNKIFLCWEGFSGNLFSGYENRSSVLEVLKESLPGEIELTLILFLRRQDDFVQSAYSQAIHQGIFEGCSKLLLNTNYNNSLNWFDYVNELREQFPKAKLEIFPYDKMLLKSTSIHSLVGEVIGSNFLMQYREETTSNVGMSTEGAELFESINSNLNADRASQKLLRRILQANSNKGVLNEYSYLTYNQKLQLLSNYEDSNKKLAELFWKEKFGLSNFSKPLKDTEKKKDNVKVEEKIIKELLLIIQKQRRKLRNSIILRVANKINSLTGL